MTDKNLENLLLLVILVKLFSRFQTITMNSAIATYCSVLPGLDSFFRSLSVADVDSCVVVESAFPEVERCSEEKVATVDSSGYL